MERKLTTILAADVVGYSALMERDESGTHERLSARRKELFEPEIARHHGRIFKLMGDGLLAEFGSVVDAVECAVSLQRGLTERNNEVPRDQQIQLRIGINLGEVIVEGDDRFGEGVNIAARLEQLAEPGGICVSGKVAKEVEKKMAFGFQPMGAQKVKNIAEPVEAFRVKLDIQPGPRRAAPARKRISAALVVALVVVALGLAGWAWLSWQGTGINVAYPELASTDEGGTPVIAVMPFENMSGDPKLEYFSDGMTGNLISMLAGVTELKVISKNSTFAYKGKPTDARKIGHDLNATYLIEGGIWKEAERVRITAQLIDARSGENVWAEKFDRSGSDPLALQDEVTERIIGTLGGQRGIMYRNEFKKAWEKDPTKLGEYDFYLRSNSFFQKFTPESAAEAMKITEEGLAKYPDSALLLFALAWDHVLIAVNAFDRKPGEHWRRASEILNETLKRSDLTPDERKSGLWAYVYVSAHDGKFDQALHAADELITLAPGDAFLIGDLSSQARWDGDTEKALERADYGRRNDPSFSDYYVSLKANALTDVERYAESAELLVNTADVNVGIPLIRAINFVHLGKPDQARTEVAKALAVLSWFTAASYRDTMFNKNPAVIDRQVADLISVGLPEK